jgi:hypothetical protein
MLLLSIIPAILILIVLRIGWLGLARGLADASAIGI